MPQSATELLRRAQVVVAPETFVLVGLSHDEWLQLLQQPELSPRGDAPYMMLRDRYEVTMLLTEEDWRAMRHAARNARVEKDFRLLTFNLELEWSIVGFMAQVAAILAQAGVSIGPLSAFSRDHLLIKQEHLGAALKALGEHVAELC
jgi:hypothetical protein